MRKRCAVQGVLIRRGNTGILWPSLDLSATARACDDIALRAPAVPPSCALRWIVSLLPQRWRQLSGFQIPSGMPREPQHSGWHSCWDMGGGLMGKGEGMSAVAADANCLIINWIDIPPSLQLILQRSLDSCSTHGHIDNLFLKVSSTDGPFL